MCVNTGHGGGTLRLQGEEAIKVKEFKYLGSNVQSDGEWWRGGEGNAKCWSVVER